MANRAMANKVRKSQMLSIAAAVERQSDERYEATKYRGHYTSKAELRDMVAKATITTNIVTRCDDGKATGLSRDIGTVGRKNAKRFSQCYGDGKRDASHQRALIDMRNSATRAMNEPWPLFTKA